jgi:hypothetical protein
MGKCIKSKIRNQKSKINLTIRKTIAENEGATFVAQCGILSPTKSKKSDIRIPWYWFLLKSTIHALFSSQGRTSIRRASSHT